MTGLARGLYETLVTEAELAALAGSGLSAERGDVHRAEVAESTGALLIRRSGIRPLLDALRHHCEAGRGLDKLSRTRAASGYGALVIERLRRGSQR
jgi:hypothetical protein